MAPAPAPASAPPAPTPPEPPFGSAALLHEYRSTLGALEALISGGLAAKKRELCEAAAAIERNMGEVRSAADGLRREMDAEAAALAEALGGKQKQKLAVLQHDLSGYAVDLEEIDTFIGETLKLSAAGAAGGASAAQRAQALVERQHELTSRGQRLASKPVAPPIAVRSDDLPDAVGERRAARRRLEALEGLVRVKDEVVAALVEEVEEARRLRAEQSAYVTRAHAYAEGVQSGAHGEVQEWASLLEAATGKLERAEEELVGSRREAAELRAQNDEMRAQNEELREHCEELRQMVMRAVGVPDAAAPTVVAA